MALEEEALHVSSKAELKRKEKQKKKAKCGGFESLGVSPNVYRGIKHKGYRVPTWIKRKTMPLICLLMIKTESGAKVKANKTGIYKKWKQQSHNKISLKGTINEGNAKESMSMSGDRISQGNNWKFEGSKKQYTVPNAHVRSEIKDLEQVRKERQKKANKISYMKNKSGKSGKRGKAKS